ncbi:MAG: efflux RND transporter permease subunit [Planctomycetota bacterium]|nr:efflux RND transporter permease subunit [Planctomycetota bacterium]
MIAKLIQWCVGNRAMVLLLTVFLVAAGVWSVFHIKIDAIPDLSDVQVIIRTEYPGQAPQIVEDQVTYPLTTTMLSVPHAKVVRGYSMFGSSFVYIIFEDGTDMYWARSRVLEQLNFVAGSLPAGINPQLGPDATGVGWVFEYVLLTGKYCPNHPNGLWHDPETDIWYADVPDDPAVRQRLVRHRVFQDTKAIFADVQENRRYESVDDAPPEARSRLKRIVLTAGYDRCPLDDEPLRPSDQDLSDLRGIQDWYLRYELTAVEGVSEVAAIGGFVKQYQVVVDPVKLLAYNLPLSKIKTAIKRSNVDVGGRLIEMSETEYMVRGVGYLGSLTDREIAEARAKGLSVEEARTQRALDELRTISLGATEDGSPIYLAELADIRIGPDIRRGVAEWNGEGEVVGGIIVMRFGENARATIQRVRDKLTELEKGLPPGIAIEVGYDRSDLIDRAIVTVRNTLIEEVIVVSLVIILFLLHARSALVAAFVLPTGVLSTLALMNLLDINANIMSLGGIAISIGVMVDSSIVMVENAHKHLEREKQRVAEGGQARPRSAVIAEAAAEVGPTLFFSLLIITVSFLPIFALGEQSGRLFKPLAYTKTFAMASAAILAITVIPVLMIYFIAERMLPVQLGRGKRVLAYLALIVAPAIVLAYVPLPTLGDYRWWLVAGWVGLSALIILPQKLLSEERNPMSLLLQRLYNPFFVFTMHYRWLTLLVAAVVMAATVWPYSRLGSEFMPPLEEGDLLYMPTTDPGISMTKARELLQQTDKLIMQFPEVHTVMGKIGRAETGTDPAPLSMVETTITLWRDKSKWRRVPVKRFYRNFPPWLKWLPSTVLAETRTITINELVYGYEWPDGPHVPGLNEIIQIPGLTNSWTMPIKTRIDMLSTGIKTPVGIKVMGPDLATLADLSNQIAQVVKTAPGTGAYTTSAFPEKSVGGNYLDITIDREEIARYGLTVGDVQDVIMSALGGMNVSWTVEGLERYPINVRYPHELRDNLPALRQVLVATPLGAQVPLAQLASFTIHKGPPMVKSENARLTSWVYVDIAGIDVGTYVKNAQRAVNEQVSLPPGYNIIWSGQYEYMQAARERLMVVVPLAGVLIILLLYMATKSWLRVFILVLSLPFSLVGAIWLLYLLEYNLSMAVWVGVIALAGLATETGLVMLLYLDNSFERFKAEGRMRNPDDLWHAVHEGAVQRIRPKTMTVMTTFIGLVPLLWASGAGADTMRRLAAPMIGGLATAFILELLLYPVIFYLAKRIALRHEFRRLAGS